MIQAAAKSLTLDDFVKLYPKDGGRYELRHREIVETRPIGPHEELIGKMTTQLS